MTSNICKNCGKEKGLHEYGALACPIVFDKFGDPTFWSNTLRYEERINESPFIADIVKELEQKVKEQNERVDMLFSAVENLTSIVLNLGRDK